uniref:Cadherin domain-containing protein n=1 Tax=Setaria digitata TaxID=48799 RepID=A0A915PWV2_9BILA
MKFVTGSEEVALVMHMSLYIEARDGGIPIQSREAVALIDIEPGDVVTLSGMQSTFDAVPSGDKMQFSQRNYSISISESVHPPHLLLILPVLNTSENERFMSCSIISGNYEEAFNISLSPKDNCELRIQTQVDRETMESYQLNVTVQTEQGVDHATVHVTILDANDNAPKFIYDNDEYNTYFAALPDGASLLTHVVTVKADDPDLENNSAVVYSLDSSSKDSKFFMCSLAGEIRTKMSVSEMVEGSRKSHFTFQVIGCDSPVTGKKLCSKAEVSVNIIADSNRFILLALSTEPQHLRFNRKKMAKVLQEFTEPCKLLLLERTEEILDSINKTRYINMLWYAVNPVTKRSCRVEEYGKLFDNSTIKLVAAKLKPHIVIGKIYNNLKTDRSVLSKNMLFFTNFKTPEKAMIALAIIVVVGALIAICAICISYIHHLLKRHSKRDYPNISQIPKLGAIFITGPAAGSSHDMLYETQMLEMPIREEDSMIKTLGTGLSTAAQGINSCDLNYAQNYQNCVQDSLADEGNFSTEESIIRGVSGQKRKLKGIVIPAPDYPMDQKKSVL